MKLKHTRNAHSIAFCGEPICNAILGFVEAHEQTED